MRMSRRQPTIWEFNKELLFGELGSFLVAYFAANAVAHFTRIAAIISGTAVAGTLIGGTIFWLIARIVHQRAGNRWSARGLAVDIGYFTPATLVLSFLVYDPAIYLVSHALLVGGSSVAASVFVGQTTAFILFLAGMNAYRIILVKVRGRHL